MRESVHQKRKAPEQPGAAKGTLFVAHRIKRHAVRGKKRKTAEKHKGDPRTWPFLLQDLEASKAMKKLITGPREFISEAFVRDSISRHLGMRPEDVTRNQIRHAVADLLTYYPAITVIPQGPAPDLDKAELGELGNAVNEEEDSTSDRPTSVTRDSQKTSNPSHEQFQIMVDAAKQLLLGDMQQVAGRLRSTPISLLGQLFFDASQQCIRDGFARFLRIAKGFPNQIQMNPAKWARLMAAAVITESVKDGPFEVSLQQLLSLLNTEEAKTIFLEEVIIDPTSTVNRIALTNADSPEKTPEPSEGTRADVEPAKDSKGIIESKKKRGPQAKMDFHRAVAEVVHSFELNWKKHLEQIAGKLDKRNLSPPVAWAKRNPPARSWKRAVEQYPDVLLKALAYSLKMTARDVTGKPSQTLAHPR